MAKTHSSLTGADLHSPQGFGNENATEVWVVSQSINKVNLSSSFLPTEEAAFDLGSAALSWKDIYVSSGSIKFIDPSDNSVLQTLTADSNGVSFGSGDISGSTISGSKLHIVGDTFIGGNLTLGDADTDSISITADLTSNLTPNADVTYDLGTTSKQWKDLFVGRALVGQTGSLHPSASFTALMDGRAGMMLPSASSDPTGLGTTEKGMTYFNLTDNLMKVYSGTDWVPVGSTETKDNVLSIAADSDGNNASSAIKMRVDGTADAQNKLVLQSDNLHKMTGSINISGSITATSAPNTTTTITANNITNGYPTSNNWGESLDGSYFNNFDNTTNVSEILRFMAGIISHSIDTSSPTSNTKTFASVDTNDNSLGNTDTIGGYLPQEHASLSNATINYLNTKDWWKTGGTCFSGLTVYYQNGPTHYIDFDSNSGGSTSVRSSADNELFGLGVLTSGGETEFKVRVHATQSFSDTGSIAAPTAASNTFTTQSYIDYSITSFGISNGLTLAKIASANPAVIPAAYQDGKFENVGGISQMSGSLSRKYHVTKGSFTSVSASGWYRFHDLKVGMATGSGNYQEVNGTTKNRFWAPTTTIDTAIGDNTISDVGTTHKALTATSRSLSGVPYLIDATFEISTKITGLFNPAYAASTTLVDMAADSVGVGTATLSGDTVSTNGGTVQTSGKVFQSDGTTAVDSGVPRYDDIVIMTASVSYDSGNADSINQTGVSDTSFTVKTKARNRNSSQSALDTQTISYHTAGDFSQPAASGSLGIYGRAQSYDGGTLQGTTELFTGEDFRIQLLDNVQAFNGTAWVTTYVLGQLGDYDLQVKPGYLVDPGGTYRYWHPASYGSGAYKYYIRRFQTDGSTYSSMTLDVGKTLVNWAATTADSVAATILFESSGNGSGNNASLGVARIYDPTKTTSNLIEADIANDNFKNPLSTAISLYGNSGGSISSTEYTIPIRNADGMYLDSNDNEFYVIVRYKGDPSPVTSITLTFS
jgi:hypothetical protein